MTLRTAPFRALWWSTLAVLLGGCSSLPFFSNKDEAAAAAPSEPEVALYEFEVEAPSPLRALLLEYLDLARFQKAPQSEGVAGTELEGEVHHGHESPLAIAGRVDESLRDRPTTRFLDQCEVGS